MDGECARTWRSRQGDCGQRAESAAWTPEMVPMNQLIRDESSVSNAILNRMPGHHGTCMDALTAAARTQNSGVLARG